MSKLKKEIPNYNMSLIETHCHLDYLKELSTEDIIAKSFEYNIEKIITIAVSPANLDEVVNITEKYENVYGTQGIHPHEARLVTDEVFLRVRENLSKEKILAVGEIGLDYHYNKSEKKDQVKVFEKFLEMACETDLPVVIHTRDADEDTMSIIKNYANKLNKKGVIHSFTSSIGLAEFCLDQGFCLGFNGIITFKNAQNVRDVLSITPLDKILIETDAPFLTPDPFRGRENAPYYLPLVAKKIAEVKNVDIDELLSIAYKNSIRVFEF